MQIIEFYNQNACSVKKIHRTLLPTFFLPKMQELDLYDIWLEQDGGTCNTACLTMDFLRGEFGEHFILRLGPVNWKIFDTINRAVIWKALKRKIVP